MVDYTLHCGDCVDYMATMADNSVDLVFTSPPYYNAMDYAQYESYNHYLDFMGSFISCVKNVLSIDGFFVLNTSPVIVARSSRNNESVRLPIPFDTFQIAQSCGFKYIDDIIWKKPDGASSRAIKFAHHRRPCAYKPFTVTEYLMVFRHASAPLIDNAIRKHSDEVIKRSLVLGDYERTNVWEICPVSSEDHPAPFPVRLAEKVVQYYSFVDDTVFDPFMGSGSTGVAAIKHGRRFIGCDLSERWVKRTEQRILTEAQTVQPSLLEVA